MYVIWKGKGRTDSLTKENRLMDGQMDGQTMDERKDGRTDEQRTDVRTVRETDRTTNIWMDGLKLGRIHLRMDKEYKQCFSAECSLSLVIYLVI